VTTRRNNPEDSHLHTRRRENLKSHLVNIYGEVTVRYVRTLIALMMEAENTSETSVKFHQTTRFNNPENSHLHLLSFFLLSKNLKMKVYKLEFYLFRMGVKLDPLHYGKNAG
jgi:hypothetical protein